MDGHSVETNKLTLKSQFLLRIFIILQIWFVPNLAITMENRRIELNKSWQI